MSDLGRYGFGSPGVGADVGASYGGAGARTTSAHAAERVPSGGNNATALSDLLKALGPQAGTQADALKPYKSSTQVNPLQMQAFTGARGAQTNAQAAQDQMARFADALASKQQAQLVNAAQAGRDLTANALSDVRAGAGARGGGAGSGLSNILQTKAAMSGNRQNQAMAADLTAKALEAEQAARMGVITGATGVTNAAGGVTTAAGQAAADQTKRDENAADIWKYSNDFQLKKTQADQAQKNYITDTIMKYLHPFTGSE